MDSQKYQIENANNSDILKNILLSTSHPYNTPECVTRKYSPFLIGAIYGATHPLRYTKINL
jgi:hypothetical protein